MKTWHKMVGTLSGLVLASAAVLYHGPVVKAAPAGGTITGTVKLSGTPPKNKPIDMSKEPSCAKVHTTPIDTQNVVVGPNGGLEYVVVYLKDYKDTGAPPSEVEFDQKGCQYVPHVVALDVNQKFKVINSDQTSHNIHPLPKNNREWNKSQPPGTAPFEESFSSEEIAIPVKCNVHPWMHGYIAVVKGPHAVTDASGNFTLQDVAPGTYTLTTWQEKYGSQTQQVTVAPGKPAQVSITYKAM